MTAQHHFTKNCTILYAEKAKQVPTSSSTGQKSAVQPNDHPFQSAQDGQGNATIGRPIYYQVYRDA
jgi:hypothetical protein